MIPLLKRGLAALAVVLSFSFSADAPGGRWIDRLLIEPSGRSYIGRNQFGAVVRGLKL